MQRYVIPFGELDLEHVELVGGKSANLGELTRAGFPVPPGFAVTTLAFDRVVSGEQRREVVEAIPVPAEVAEAVQAGYQALAAELGREEPAVAVRSSAVAEDAAEASFAGVQSTYLWLRGLDEVLLGVRRCWASSFNPEAVAYRAAHGVEAGGMSVAIQSMVDARVAGVMFTLNPVSGDPSSVAIEASWGFGVTVVGGEVTPDSFLLSKVTREIVRSELGAKEVECVPDEARRGTVTRPVPAELRSRLCLTPEELGRLGDLARHVERHYGTHQDLEWALARDLEPPDDLFLLQSRPETVWSRKRRADSAGTSAIDRITATYLGRARGA